MKTRQIANKRLHSRYLRRFFGAEIAAALDPDVVEALLNQPARPGDFCPADDRVINLAERIAVFGAPAITGRSTVGYKLRTQYYVVRWDGAHPRVVKRTGSALALEEYASPDLSPERLRWLITRYAHSGAWISPDYAVYASGAVLRACGGCSGCGYPYVSGGRKYVL